MQSFGKNSTLVSLKLLHFSTIVSFSNRKKYEQILSRTNRTYHRLHFVLSKFRFLKISKGLLVWTQKVNWMMMVGHQRLLYYRKCFGEKSLTHYNKLCNHEKWTLQPDGGIAYHHHHHHRQQQHWCSVLWLPPLPPPPPPLVTNRSLNFHYCNSHHHKLV